MSIELLVTGMSCGHCVQSITQAITALEASAVVEVELATGLVKIESGQDVATLIETIEALGFDATAP